MSGTVILANGDFPSHPTALQCLAEAEHLVCCDGAVAQLERSGLRQPDVIVGDLDSIPNNTLEKHRGKIVHVSEQDTNDLQKAFRLCLERGWIANGLTILGAVGRRDDHTLGNISTLFTFAQTAPKVELMTDYGLFQVLQRSGSIDCQPGEQLSIFSDNPLMPVTSDGLKYPLKTLKLTHWWNGTLNECVSNHVTLSFPDGNGMLLIYRAWQGAAVCSSHNNCYHIHQRRIHFCGCGGVGMAGLAQIALDDGCAVSGSDSAESPQFAELRRQGADVRLGHSADAIGSEIELLVYSAAVPVDNPERLAASRLGIPQCSRGQFLARIAPLFGKVIAIAGTHGKTTTTAMLSHIIRHCGRNTGFMIGGIVTGWERFASAGDWSMLVTEVDESDRSQEMMLPDMSIILNVDDDHCWAMGGPEVLANSFRTLARHSLTLLRNRDSSLPDGITTQGDLTFSTQDVPLDALPECCPGEHNRMDASAALAAAEWLGIPKERALTALACFPGVQRRLTLKRRSDDGRKIYFDDYAHHPTELEAGLKALRQRYPSHRMVVFFQPHRPERILRYGVTFAKLLEQHSDHCYIVTPFLAWESAQANATPESIADMANTLRNGCAEVIASRPEVIATEIKHIFDNTDEPTIVLTAGAGDIGKAATSFINSLQNNNLQDK